MQEFMAWLVENKEWLFSGAGLLIFSVMGRLLFKRIRAASTQTIRSGDSSTNVQAGRDVNIGPKKKGNDVEEG